MRKFLNTDDCSAFAEQLYALPGQIAFLALVKQNPFGILIFANSKNCLTG